MGVLSIKTYLGFAIDVEFLPPKVRQSIFIFSFFHKKNLQA